MLTVYPRNGKPQRLHGPWLTCVQDLRKGWFGPNSVQQPIIIHEWAFNHLSCHGFI